MEQTTKRSGSSSSQLSQGARLTRQDIAKLIGLTVTVFAGMVHNVEDQQANSTFISITGKLEKDPDQPNRYRVQTSDRTCFTGFGELDVLSAERPEEQQRNSKIGETKVEAVIKIKLQDYLQGAEERES